MKKNYQHRYATKNTKAKKPFGGAPYHGQYVTGGRLTGRTDTDHFYFFCPKCPGERILQIPDFAVVRDDSPDLYVEMRPGAKRDFTVVFKLYCPRCKLKDFVKVSNTDWQGGTLR